MPDFEKQGPSGGMVGDFFSDDALDHKHRIKQIQLWFNSAPVTLGGIMVQYEDLNGDTHDLPPHGSTVGNLNLLTLDDNEYLVGVRGRAGLMVDWLQFETSKQERSFGNDTGGTASFSYRAPKDYEISGFHGLAGTPQSYAAMIPGADDVFGWLGIDPDSNATNIIAIGVMLRALRKDA